MHINSLPSNEEIAKMTAATVATTVLKLVKGGQTISCEAALDVNRFLSHAACKLAADYFAENPVSLKPKTQKVKRQPMLGERVKLVGQIWGKITDLQLLSVTVLREKGSATTRVWISNLEIHPEQPDAWIEIDDEERL